MKALYLFCTFVLLIIWLTSGESTVQNKQGYSKDKIIGKWYYKSRGDEGIDIYAKDSSIARSIEFKRNGTAFYSHCTDICGCLRITYQGEWKWKDSDKIVATFKEAKRALQGQKGFQPIQKFIVELEVIELQRNELKVKVDRN